MDLPGLPEVVVNNLTGGQMILVIMCLLVCLHVALVAYFSGKYQKRKEEEEEER
jgi:flagellar basal body-associated protein FliL